MSWVCSGLKLSERIGNLRKGDALFLSQCGFVFSSGEGLVAVDPMISDLTDDAGRSRRIVPPPFDVEGMPCLDAILVTHGHDDHCDFRLIESQNCVVIAPSSVLETLSIPDGRKVDISDYGSFGTAGFGITAIPVPHMEYSGSDGHSDHYGYILQFSGIAVFHSGDTIVHERLAADLKKYGPFDYMFLPVNGRDAERESQGIIGNMDSAEAVDFAISLSAGTLVPMHFDMMRGNTADITEFCSAADGRIPYIVPEQGGLIHLC